MKKYNINLDKLHSSKQSLKELKLLNFKISYCSIKYCVRRKSYFYFLLLLLLFKWSTCTFYSSNFWGVTLLCNGV